MEVFDLGRFVLSSGVTIPDAKLGYQTRGKLNSAKDNVVVFPAFLGAEPDALDRWVGEGRPLDPNKYFIVMPGHFGLPPTSSPSNTPAPLDGGGFPAVSIADDIVAQHKLLTEHWGIEEIQLVLGWSVGSLQTFEWAVRYPDMVRRMASIAGAPRPSPWTKLWLEYALEEQITGDPAYRGGFYTDKREVQAGMRRMAHVTSMTLPPKGFYKEGEEVWRPLGFFAATEDVVAHFFEAFWLPKEPADIVAQARKARAADPARGGDLTEALAGIKAKSLVVAFTNDFMFPPDESERDAAKIPGAKYVEVNSVFGHLATFALDENDVKAVDELLSELLAS